MFKTVLFPVDQSREAREAADVVVNVVQKYGSKLILLSVVEEPSQEPEVSPLNSDAAMTSPEAVAELLKTAQNLFADQGIQSQTIERQGKPAFTICDVADEIDADLIVMGCRGLGLTEEGMTDSVTNRVINLSPCPVLIVP
ncbi:universal stress protein [Coleofasciculus sp. FACHB-64]|uniref:universal stress protein n=1 Tax=Cyanophyceae TaxID=3028117 RepID=UPI00168416F0|nr:MULTISPECIES: universal stress protein [unclassified Coleofasciculus]MBD1839402.1 universal stress protein [Coleofasciculus sp. FACHB-501]MBD1879285.1 universal stress protein [Coleofasciculus sp. FACHB-T130]MBD1892074.1 universal stress protein [Coleofasciculus sp. FACHB-SPT9]MBD1897842.1 universal stress protein [Coleofasciculus sp. FACHB-129]MBD2045180.1 universal stress protein [Coleofasciculus sp. FACHB-64]